MIGSFVFFIIGAVAWIVFVVATWISGDPMFDWWQWLIWLAGLAFIVAIYSGIVEIQNKLKEMSEKEKEK